MVAWVAGLLWSQRYVKVVQGGVGPCAGCLVLWGSTSHTEAGSVTSWSNVTLEVRSMR